MWIVGYCFDRVEMADKRYIAGPRVACDNSCGKNCTSVHRIASCKVRAVRRPGQASKPCTTWAVNKRLANSAGFSPGVGSPEFDSAVVGLSGEIPAGGIPTNAFDEALVVFEDS